MQGQAERSILPEQGVQPPVRGRRGENNPLEGECVTPTVEHEACCTQHRRCRATCLEGRCQGQAGFCFFYNMLPCLVSSKATGSGLQSVLTSAGC
mgnify:CR=1 FL=1